MFFWNSGFELGWAATYFTRQQRIPGCEPLAESRHGNWPGFQCDGTLKRNFPGLTVEQPVDIDVVGIDGSHINVKAYLGMKR